MTDTVTDDHVLQVSGREVARYRVGVEDIEPMLGPRPHLHPIRTLGGTVVTDTFPADHRWHLGFSVAIPKVTAYSASGTPIDTGTNFWGGGTYRPEDGYQLRGDHGAVEHERWLHRGPAAVEHELRWVGHTGEVLLREHRRIDATESDGYWSLTQTTVLRNATERTIALGSPGSAGRVGAGYGGFFWRLPLGPTRVSGPGMDGEDELNGAVTPWLAVHGQDFTLVLRSDDGDPWFVRVGIYPGAGAALAWDAPLPLAPGADVRRTLRVAVADGERSAEDLP